MCLNSALQGEEKSLWECRASLLSHALGLVTGTSSLPAVSNASSTEAQQERCKSQDGLDPVALQASAAGSPFRPPVSKRNRRSAGPLLSSSDTLPATSAHSRDSAQASLSAPTQPDQGTTTHLAAGASLPTTSTLSPRTKRKSTWAADLAGSLPDPSSASPTTTLARQRVSDFTVLQKLDAIAAAITQHKPVVLHGQQQGTRSLKQFHPYFRPAASAVALASSSAPTQPAQGTTAPSAAGVSLPTTSTWSLAGTLSNPSSASHTTTLARQRVSDFTVLQKLDTIATAITQPKPVVLHGQQQGTRNLKQPHPSSHPAASAAAQASSSAPTQPAQGTTAPSAAGVSVPTTFTWSLAGTLSNPSSASLITTQARLTISGPTSLPKVAVTVAATTQPKPVVLHGQQQGTHGLKQAHPYSDPAALALSHPTKRKLTWAAGLAGTHSKPSSDSLITTVARLMISGPTSLPKVAVTAAAITQPKPAVLHGQQQGTHGLKRARPYSDPAALALSPPTKRKLVSGYTRQILGQAIPGKARQGYSRQGNSRQCQARQGKARDSNAIPGKAMQSQERQLQERQFQARQGKTRQGKEIQGKAIAGKIRQVNSREGNSKQGKARQGNSRQDKARVFQAKQF
uniref:putative POM121-like protein 1-like isoform X1 n=1 Tax=Callithrix jacchus TaxID=9483 RepID=UPI0023DD0FDA|nr:putative POM121-like protein 1-like isoform X1 [Callithrix jacchus]